MDTSKKMEKGDCPLCGFFRYLQRDHIKPKWQGGADTPENSQYICYDCHRDKTVREYKEGSTAPQHTWHHITPEQRALGAQRANNTLNARYGQEGRAAQIAHARKFIDPAKRSASQIKAWTTRRARYGGTGYAKPQS